MNEDMLAKVKETMAINRRIRMGLERRFKVGANRPKISLGQYTLLTVLDEFGEAPMGDVAKEMGLSLGGLTGLVDRVIGMGFVERFRIPEDRRIVKVGLTAKGRETLQAILDVDREFAASVLSQLTEEEIQTFLKVFGMMANGLKNEEPVTTKVMQ